VLFWDSSKIGLSGEASTLKLLHLRPLYDVILNKTSQYYAMLLVTMSPDDHVFNVSTGLEKNENAIQSNPA
jgi:hypothetical protein